MQNKNIDSYKVVTEGMVLKLETQVNKLIKERWQPYGEMKFSPENENYTRSFYQPMVKYS